MRPLNYVFLAGMANSGSTLVSFLLNAHPEIVSVGEVDWIDRNIEERWRTGQGRCSCGQTYAADPFWQAVRAEVEQQGAAFGKPYFYNRSRRAESDRRLAAFTAAVLKISGKRIFLDTSKKPDYLFSLRSNHELELLVINLYRDGEGVVNSWRKHSKLPVEWLTRQWIWRERKRAFILSKIPDEQVFNLKFECLVEEPEQMLRQVFQFLGVDDTVVLTEGYKSRVKHHIVGNQMRLDGKETIRSDSQWRRQLSPDLRAAFRRAGGMKMNRKNGYREESNEVF